MNLPPLRRDALALVAATVLCVGCAAATRTPLPAWDSVALPAWAQWTTQPTVTVPSTQATLPPLESLPSSEGVPPWLAVIGFLVGCALLAWLARLTRSALGAQMASRLTPQLTGISDPMAVVSEARAQTRAVIDSDLRRRCETRGAVERCWRALEAEAATRGARRSPAMATDAYVALLHERLGLDAVALATLEQLYATTLYGDGSDIDPTEARACLRRLFPDHEPSAP